MDSKPLALVTGGGTGIGAAYARALAGAGYGLLLVGRREEKLRAMRDEVGGEILVADLATEQGLGAVERRVAEAANLDFLVNNAGFGTMGAFWEVPIEVQDQMHRLHVLATLRLTHAALPAMVARNRGSIVNVSSVAAFVQAIGTVSYSATKAWMNSFTEGLSLELKSARSGVRVQALCPGFTRSEFHEAAGLDKIAIPESLWTTAEDVVRASLRGLARDELIVIPGWRYRTWVGLQRILPRAAVHAIVRKSKDKFRNSDSY